MKASTSLVIATLLAGAVSVSAVAPGFAQEQASNQRGGEQQERMGKRGAGGPGSFVRLMCSEDGATRLETALGNVSEKLELTDDQLALYETLKATALTAQTEYADNCVAPVRGEAAEEGTDFIDRMRNRQTNMEAHLAAMDDVVPALEAFYDSLTDEQKASLKPEGKGKRGGKGPRGPQRG